MGKCSPVAAKILSTWRRGESDADIAGAEFVDFVDGWGAAPPFFLRFIAKFNTTDGCRTLLVRWDLAEAHAKHVAKLKEYLHAKA
jgi:hypothetical protein